MQNNPQLLAVLNALPHGVYIISKDAEIEFVNEAIRKEFGPVEGRKCYEYFHGRSENCPWCKSKDVFAGKSVRWEWYSEKADKYYDLYDFPVTNSDGTTSKFEVFIDITSLKKAEAKANHDSERLNVTLRSIGDGVITTDLDGKIILINKVTEELTGWTQTEAVGRSVGEVFHILNEKTGKPANNPVDKVLKTHSIVTLENHTVLVAKDGCRYLIEDSAAPIFDKESKIIGTVLVFRDVSEKLKIADELLKVQKLESIGVLAGGIAHDFNNFLAAILGNIELAGMFVDSDSEAMPLLEEAKKASLRARDLTRQLLTFSKGGDPVKQTTSLHNLVRDSANFVLHGSSALCEFEIPEDLWMVDVDTGQISQVIQNIILNARHAMPDGGTIKVKCENVAAIVDNKGSGAPLSEKDCIKLTISDTGVGIPQKYLMKIFDPYFSTKQDGSGLGLAICHSIIKKHDGNISVRSDPDEGTTFTITLPAASQEADICKSSEEGLVKSSIKARILVMDDEAMVRNTAKRMLEVMGHEVWVAEHGDEAVKIYSEHYGSDRAIDMVIMDLTIPGGMGGKDAVAEIIEINSEANVVVSSGYSNDPVMAHYQDYGFKAALAKPFHMAELCKIIDQLLI